MDKPNHVMDYYHGFDARARFHVWLRWRLFPFDRLLDFIPVEGTAADLGCGHGHWALFLAMQRPGLEVWGIDPDKEKIQVAAKAAAGHFDNLYFTAGLAEEARYPQCDVISLIDVLYLVPHGGQESILKHAAAQLKPGGRLLLKEMGHTPRWKYFWNAFQETLSVRLLGVTYGSRFYFRTAEEWGRILEQAGLVVEFTPLHKGYPYPHLLVTGIKPV